MYKWRTTDEIIQRSLFSASLQVCYIGYRLKSVLISLNKYTQFLSDIKSVFISLNKYTQFLSNNRVQTLTIYSILLNGTKNCITSPFNSRVPTLTSPYSSDYGCDSEDEVCRTINGKMTSFFKLFALFTPRFHYKIVKL